jgi:glyoxylase-like metal-dependent hydrolase (beta-lactamase superfamily II)
LRKNSGQNTGFWYQLILIDTGLVGEIPRLTRILREIDMGWSDIKAILLTHGHLDHTGNLARLKELTGALVLAHLLEQPHIDGAFPYTGSTTTPACEQSASLRR